jgi:Protein of unknown function (DUF2934)
MSRSSSMQTLDIYDDAIEVSQDPVYNFGDTPAETREDEIARLAYQFWEERGQTNGSAMEDWLRAEQEIRARDASVYRRLT